MVKSIICSFAIIYFGISTSLIPLSVGNDSLLILSEKTIEGRENLLDMVHFGSDGDSPVTSFPKNDNLFVKPQTKV